MNSNNMPMFTNGSVIYTYTGTSTDWTQENGPGTNIQAIRDSGSIVINTNNEYWVKIHDQWVLKYFDIFDFTISNYNPSQEPSWWFHNVSENGRTVLLSAREYNNPYGACIIKLLYTDEYVGPELELPEPVPEPIPVD